MLKRKNGKLFSTIYFKDGKVLKHFLCITDEKSDKSIMLKKIKTIEENAFENSTTVNEIYFDKNLTAIKKSAFSNCENLKIFGYVPEKNNNSKPLECYELELPTNPKGNNFKIESLAFSNCKNLHTVILPECKNLTIEKDAFKNCENLRSIFIPAKKVMLTENPFKDCDNLVLISNNETIKKFARENDFRCISCNEDKKTQTDKVKNLKVNNK